MRHHNVRVTVGLTNPLSRHIISPIGFMGPIEPKLETTEFTSKLAAIPGLQLRENEPLGKHVSMGVGGPARWFVVADTENALDTLLAILRETGIPWMVLGGGSNTIYGQHGYDGVVITL